MFQRLIFLGLLLICVCDHAYGQDEQHVRGHALKSAMRASEIATLHLKARVTGHDNSQIIDGEVEVQIQGDRTWISLPPHSIRDQDTSVEYIARLYAASGSKLPSIFSFDGTHTYSYEPLRLFMVRREAVEAEMPRWARTILPNGWVSISGVPQLDVQTILSDKYAAQCDLPSDPIRPWTFTKTSTSDQIAFNRVAITIDPGQGYNATNFETTGGLLGNSNMQLDWEEMQGMWYPKRMTVKDYRGFVVEWEITEIKIGGNIEWKSFTLSDNFLPTGTRVKYILPSNESSVRSTTKEHFVGGDDGSREYGLRMRAIAKIREGEK